MKTLSILLISFFVSSTMTAPYKRKSSGNLFENKDTYSPNIVKVNEISQPLYEPSFYKLPMEKTYDPPFTINTYTLTSNERNRQSLKLNESFNIISDNNEIYNELPTYILPYEAPSFYSDAQPDYTHAFVSSKYEMMPNIDNPNVPLYEPSYEQLYEPSYEQLYEPSYEQFYEPSYESSYESSYEPSLNNFFRPSAWNPSSSYEIKPINEYTDKSQSYTTPSYANGPSYYMTFYENSFNPSYQSKEYDGEYVSEDFNNPSIKNFYEMPDYTAVYENKDSINNGPSYEDNIYNEYEPIYNLNFEVPSYHSDDSSNYLSNLENSETENIYEPSYETKSYSNDLNMPKFYKSNPSNKKYEPKNKNTKYSEESYEDSYKPTYQKRIFESEAYAEDSYKPSKKNIYEPSYETKSYSKDLNMPKFYKSNPSNKKYEPKKENSEESHEDSYKPTYQKKMFESDSYSDNAYKPSMKNTYEPSYETKSYNRDPYMSKSYTTTPSYEKYEPSYENTKYAEESYETQEMINEHPTYILPFEHPSYSFDSIPKYFDEHSYDSSGTFHYMQPHEPYYAQSFPALSY